jgi:hypothetical protein
MLKRSIYLCIPGAVLAFGALFATAAPPALAQGDIPYVGSEACKDCHETEYQNFKKYCKKVNSFQSVSSMKKGLTDEEYKSCLECHTTGYGKPGGFESLEKTPDLAEAGCEVCHGPGGKHVETESVEDLKRQLTAEDCDSCHSSERVEAFNYKPLIFGGAH